MEAALLITRIVGVVFVITSMVSAGLTIRASDVATNARNLRLVGATIAAGFVAPPLIVLGLTAALPIRPDYATGLMLLAGAAGAPLLPRVAEWIGASVALAVTVMMLLVTGTVLFLPLAMPHLLPGADFDPWRVARPLLVVIVAPLAAGMLARTLWGALTARLAPLVLRVSEAALAVFVVLLLATHIEEVLDTVGSGAILVSAVFVGLCGACGYLLGGPGEATRRLLSLGAAQRNIAAALVVAGSSFSDRHGVAVMIVVADLVAIAALLVTARLFGRSGAGRSVGKLRETARG